MTLGLRLKKERERRNFSQKYVAEKIGITNSVLSNYERDYRDPDTETLKKLADLYDVSLDYLLGRTDNPLPGKNEENENLFFFDLEGLSEEDIQHLKEHIEYLRKKAQKYNKGFKKED